MSEYADFPGGDRFEPWQDHEWPTHCDVRATYLAEVVVPAHAPAEGEAWDSTIHHFRCTNCTRDLLLWEAN